MRACKLLATACVLAPVVAACGDSTTTAPTTAATTTLSPSDAIVWPTDEWPVSTPEEQGMDSAMLADMVDQVVSQPGIDSVTVVRNGHVVLDAAVYPFGHDDPHIIHSCTKSVVATLIGIAIDQGLLAGVDVPVVEILGDAVPETVDDRKTAMTVEDLLTMSTGLDCRDSYVYEWKGLVEMQQSEDWTAHVLALPMRNEPGTQFEYCNGSSFLLSAILSEVTGVSAADYAQQVLFGPLGFGGFEWPANPDGITMGWGELWLHPAWGSRALVLITEVTSAARQLEGRPRRQIEQGHVNVVGCTPTDGRPARRP